MVMTAVHIATTAALIGAMNANNSATHSVAYGPPGPHDAQIVAALVLTCVWLFVWLLCYMTLDDNINYWDSDSRTMKFTLSHKMKMAFHRMSQAFGGVSLVVIVVACVITLIH